MSVSVEEHPRKSISKRVIEVILRNLLIATFCLFIFYFLDFISGNETEDSILVYCFNDYLLITFSMILVSEFTLFLDEKLNGIFSRNGKSTLFLLGKILLGQVGYVVVFTSLIAYYQRYLFENRLNTIFVVFGALYVFMFDMWMITRSYSNKLQEERNLNSQLREEKLRAELDALQNQINPHFLFNSLNVLISEIYMDQESAVTYTQHLSDIYRYVLQSIDHYTVSLKDEMAFLNSYIYLQKIKYETAFQIHVDIKEEALDKKIPVLALQLLVENAIKHNAILKDKPLVIDICSVGNRLCITNTLSPKPVTSSGGVGLKNLNSRYKLLEDKHIEVEKSASHYRVILPLIEDKKL
ncbi:histidine kinase [Halosquirtibacter xylanolyticus]|uniref:sensor histidine kinase n=1 Tax=Halosquirtibacter xylanolyticus TaxID=3374599 RepID=UPI003748F4E6|nr:histidine kinase [Prolixibacteraceae bacterium]